MAKKTLIYKELLEELNAEVAEGVLSLEDTIQIIRDDKELMPTYYPIIDWYYDAFTMKQEIDTPLEEMKKSHEAYKAQYEADAPKLKEMKLKDALTEMKQIQKLM